MYNTIKQTELQEKIQKNLKKILIKKKLYHFLSGITHRGNDGAADYLLFKSIFFKESVSAVWSLKSLI